MSHYRFMTEPEGNSETNNHSNKKHFLNHPFFQVPKEREININLYQVSLTSFSCQFCPFTVNVSDNRNLCLVPVDFVEMTKCLAKWMKSSI